MDWILYIFADRVAFLMATFMIQSVSGTSQHANGPDAKALNLGAMSYPRQGLLLVGGEDRVVFSGNIKTLRDRRFGP